MYFYRHCNVPGEIWVPHFNAKVRQDVTPEEGADGFCLMEGFLYSGDGVGVLANVCVDDEYKPWPSVHMEAPSLLQLHVFFFLY